MICRQANTWLRTMTFQAARKLAGFVALLCLHWLAASAQTLCPPYIYFEQTYGTGSDDLLTSAEELGDGGFVLGGHGWTNNYPLDYYVLRLDASGRELWARHYGGSSLDYLRAVRSTTDRGFILAGYSASDDKGSPLFGHYDGWVVRTDSNGTPLWQRSFGGTFFDGFMDVEPLRDGGYILGGSSVSQPGTGNKTSAALGDYDFWVVRIDQQGEKLWEQSFGGSTADFLYDVQPMPDGGFALIGASRSGVDGNKSATNNGNYDLWVVRLDPAGNKIWDRGFGGSLYDEGREAVVTADGGLLLAGTSHSPPSGNKESENFGAADYWLVRLDAAGNKLWERTFGGTDADIVQGLRQTPDGNVLVAGDSSSLPGPGKRSPHYGFSDYWVLQLNSAGALLWEQSLGGAQNDSPRVANRTQDGAFFAAGSSISPPSGVKAAPLYGNNDFWLVRFLPQKPDDCDLDGVIDSRDLCPGSPGGSPVDSRGCTVDQSCPCNSGWRDNDDYVHCVRQVTVEMVRLGSMTPDERALRVQQAMQADCPPSPPPPTNPPPDVPISFGFTNFALGNAVISRGAYDTGPFSVEGLGQEGADGVAFLLGQAQSGMFVYPDAPVPWGSYDPANFILGKAFGRVNGHDNLLIGALQARKTDYECYPVEVDLSALAPTSLTFQVYQKNVLRAERTVTGSSGRLVVSASINPGPRANPFWRMSDGAVGALIEFTAADAYIVLPDDSTAEGNRVFIRANNAYPVEYVSRFDVYGGGGLPYFAILGGRIGMFGLVHGLTGDSVYNAFEGRLKITSLRPELLATYSHGFQVELNESRFYDLSLEPISISPNEMMQLFVTGQSPPPNFSIPQSVSELRLSHTGTNLALSTDLWSQPVSNALVRVYKNGAIVGQTPVDGSALGSIELKGNSETPRVAGLSAQTSGSNLVTFTISFDRFVQLIPQSGTSLRGNLIQITITREVPVTGFSLATLLTMAPSFTITSETIGVVPPRLNIAASVTNAVLSWSLVNQPFALESAESLLGPFALITEEPVIGASGSTVTLPLVSGMRFFRLRSVD
jgi:hypothetical protein